MIAGTHVRVSYGQVPRPDTIMRAAQRHDAALMGVRLITSTAPATVLDTHPQFVILRAPGAEPYARAPHMLAGSEEDFERALQMLLIGAQRLRPQWHMTATFARLVAFRRQLEATGARFGHQGRNLGATTELCITTRPVHYTPQHPEMHRPIPVCDDQLTALIDDLARLAEANAATDTMLS